MCAHVRRLFVDVRIPRKKQQTPNAVILKGFNDREWKFILRSGYERLIRDKLPPTGTPALEMYKTCLLLVTKRVRFRIKLRRPR